MKRKPLFFMVKIDPGERAVFRDKDGRSYGPHCTHVTVTLKEQKMVTLYYALQDLLIERGIINDDNSE